MNKDYIIYKISCLDKAIVDVYFGSTTNFVKRKCRHKCNVNNLTSKYSKFKIYQCIRENGGWSNWEMNPIEKINCSKIEAHIKEQMYINNNTNLLNTYNPARTDEEIKNHYKEYKRNWYLNNK
jgi:hypothetical protein